MTSDKSTFRDAPIFTSIALVATTDIPFLSGPILAVAPDDPQAIFRRALQLLTQKCEQLRYVLKQDDDFSGAMRLANDLMSYWIGACEAYQQLFSIAEADSLLLVAAHAMLKSCRKRTLELLAVLFNRTEKHEESLRRLRGDVIGAFGAVTPAGVD